MRGSGDSLPSMRQLISRRKRGARDENPTKRDHKNKHHWGRPIRPRLVSVFHHPE